MSWPGVIRALVALLFGTAIGVCAYTFGYARGYSYLTNDPLACANCHVMQDHLAGWVKSSHRSVAACNDCHTPPDFVRKYLAKAENGFRHSVAFTTGRFPEPIRISPHDAAITERACRHCHAEIVAAIDAFPHRPGTSLSCLGCHRSVGHLE